MDGLFPVVCTETGVKCRTHFDLLYKYFPYDPFNYSHNTRRRVYENDRKRVFALIYNQAPELADWTRKKNPHYRKKPYQKNEFLGAADALKIISVKAHHSTVEKWITKKNAEIAKTKAQVHAKSMLCKQVDDNHHNTKPCGYIDALPLPSAEFTTPSTTIII